VAETQAAANHWEGGLKATGGVNPDWCSVPPQALYGTALEYRKKSSMPGKHQGHDDAGRPITLKRYEADEANVTRVNWAPDSMKRKVQHHLDKTQGLHDTIPPPRRPPVTSGSPSSLES
jgi:hypothetical protein